LPLVLADLLRRQVALIVGNTTSALAAKAATTIVPIVFVTGGDPVSVGSGPGGNVTGISIMSVELAAKQLGLLRELRPGAARIAVLVDPKFPATERFVSEVRAAASAMGSKSKSSTSAATGNRDRLYNALSPSHRRTPDHTMAVGAMLPASTIPLPACWKACGAASLRAATASRAAARAAYGRATLCGCRSGGPNPEQNDPGEIAEGWTRSQAI
jgi:hypothetical protein